jgi:CHAT domain-containing protein
MRIPLSRFQGRAIAAGVLLACSASAARARSPETPQAGVVVEAVKPYRAAAKAGLQPGDLLLGWTRDATPPANPELARGAFLGPLDVLETELEQAPRGPIRLHGTRGGQPLSVLLAPGEWGIDLRPRLDPDELALHLEAAGLAAEQRPEPAAELWRSLASSAQAGGEPELACWFLYRAGLSLADAGRWAEALSLYEAGLAAAVDTDGRPAPFLWEARGLAWFRLNDLASAIEAHRTALCLREERGPESLTAAQSLEQLGRAFADRDDRDAAEGCYRRSLELRERLAPGSLPVAASLGLLAALARSREDWVQEQQFCTRALEILEKLEPDGPIMAELLGSMALSNRGPGEGEWTAERLHLKALAIRERLEPGSLSVARSLNNLGLLRQSQGDLAAAEDLFRRSLQIKERLAPESMTMAVSLINLGSVAIDRGEMSLAEDFYTRANGIVAKLAPDSFYMARTVSALGDIARSRGQLDEAEARYRDALVRYERIQTEGMDVASSLEDLGKLLVQRDKLQDAEPLFRRALQILRRVSPGNVLVATYLGPLAELAVRRGDAAEAERLYAEALSIHERCYPGTAAHTGVLHALGKLHRDSGHPDEALELLRSGIDAFETQLGRFGGTQVTRSRFSAGNAELYQDLIELLVDLGRAAEAFDVLERSRGRVLLEMLAERDLVLTAGLPPELVRERLQAAQEYDRLGQELQRFDPAREPAEVKRLRSLRERLQDRSERLRLEVRKLSPRVAALQDPQPLSLAGVQHILDPGTVLLAYALGPSRGFLFVVGPAGPDRPAVFQVHPLPIGRDELRRRVEAFVGLVQDPHPGPETTAALREQGLALYRLLVEPAEPLLASASRLLICPDGPLHALPFAALVRRLEPGSAPEGPPTPHYLVEDWPMHESISATVYAELLARRAAPGTPASPQVAAFGDPRYPALAAASEASAAEPRLRAVLRRGLALEPLPATRLEVEAISGLYGAQAATYLGKQASEEAAKSLPSGTSIVHFATHGLLDERFPLDSALALSIPEPWNEGQDNGLLQAWEVFEQLRLDAELVVLSACRSALGAEMGGEGLISLTRAFQYAGARSVIASLWSVSDQSTAELMRRFYGHLKAGLPKDQALRAAQVELIHAAARQQDTARRGIGGLAPTAPEAAAPDLGSPFRWAGFVLSGDWR